MVKPGLSICTSQSDRTNFVEVLITLNHDVAVGTVASNQTFIAVCVKNSPMLYHFRCSSGENMTISCDGKSDYESKISCRRSPKAVCVSSASNETIIDTNCHVVNSTAWQTVCSCKMCPTRLLSRRLLNGMEKTAVRTSKSNAMDFVSITTYASSDFGSTMATASSFNSVNALRDTFIIWTSFLVLWASTIFLVALREIFDDEKYFTTFWKKRQKHKVQKVHQAPSPSAERSAEEKQESVQEHLQNYISVFFPHVFSSRPRTQRLIHELSYYHSYSFLLLHAKGLQRWAGLLELLTNWTCEYLTYHYPIYHLTSVDFD